MAKRRLRTYTSEFKHQAIALAAELGCTKASQRLGISKGILYSWKEKQSKPGGGLEAKVIKPDAESESVESEVRRLRKEVEELKKVNYILKRAAAFFSQDHLK